MTSNDIPKSFTSGYWHLGKQIDRMTFRGSPSSSVASSIQLPSFSHGSEKGLTENVSEDQEIQMFVKQLLVNRLFLGHYQERRLVDSLRSYRDVVVISNSEYGLKEDLETARKKVKGYPRFSRTWVGITGPEFVGAPANQAIWVKLKNLPFGQYWFQIKQVKFVDDREMYLRLKCIRPVDARVLNERGDFNPAEVPQYPDSTSESGSETVCSEISVDWHKVKNKFKTSLGEVAGGLLSFMTLHNAKEVICFTAVLLAACVTGLLHSVRYLGDYSLKFMREFSYIIRATTPIFIAIIDFFTKLVGGLYLLIAMMWHSSNQPPSTHPRKYPGFPPRAIEMSMNWQKRR